jgi:hypothetical protein
VSRAGEAKGDQRQDSGPSLNSANKPIQHRTSISWSTTVNTGFVFFFFPSLAFDVSQTKRRRPPDGRKLRPLSGQAGWTRAGPQGGCQRERPAAGRS